ncbi:MAG: porin [Alphaproteobacteria bacterium]|nr:porin [Alphaproteobacteria bacterium]MDD9919804.1 porin [Alphaproteobacteria bacterium]
MKKTLLATTALAVSGFVAGEALAVDVELYGQVNKALMMVDDGSNTDFSVVDNDVSSTRFGMKGSQALDNGLTASVLFEGEVQDNASNSVTQNLTANQSTAASDPAAAAFSSRHARVGLAGDWGAVFVGRQSTASDSVSEQDMVGVGDLMYSGPADIGGGYKIRTSTAGNALSATLTDSAIVSGSTSVGTMADNYDGNSRANAIRYDSPIFNGFQGRASIAQGGDMDIAGYYNGKVQNVALKAALGYVMFNDAAANGPSAPNKLVSQLSGSLTAALDNGFAGTVAYGNRSLDNKTTGTDDPSFFYAKVGYSWDAFEIAADYGNYNDQVTSVTTDHELGTFGFGGQYNLGNGVSVAGMYRNYDADVTGITTEDIGVYAMSLRVKF